jgi:hypothetical protein
VVAVYELAHSVRGERDAVFVGLYLCRNSDFHLLFLD